MQRFVQRDIRKNWDIIKDSIAKILIPFNERPEDVYAACTSGKAYLFTVDEGFVILQIDVDSVTGERSLFVRIASGNSQDGKSLLHEYTQDLMEIAKECQCESLTFSTVRRGFEKALPDGWKTSRVVYERRI